VEEHAGGLAGAGGTLPTRDGDLLATVDGGLVHLLGLVREKFANVVGAREVGIIVGERAIGVDAPGAEATGDAGGSCS
jgi:hypothetical protein